MLSRIRNLINSTVSYDIVIYVGIEFITTCIPYTTFIESVYKRSILNYVKESDIERYLTKMYKDKGYNKIKIEKMY